MRTSMLIAIPTAALIAVALAGCGDRATPTPEPAAPATTAAPAPPPAADTPAAAADAGMLPAADTITFAGFGPAAFGADEEHVRMAWGKDMEGAPSEPGGCHVLVPAPRGASPPQVGFMIEGGKFSRLDIRTDAIAAPGGGKVGMPASEILRLYPKHEAMPHKYVEGARTLRMKDPAGGAGVLVFETDAKDVVVAWRVGVAPQVDYVEGCY